MDEKKRKREWIMPRHAMPRRTGLRYGMGILLAFVMVFSPWPVSSFAVSASETRESGLCKQETPGASVPKITAETTESVSDLNGLKAAVDKANKDQAVSVRLGADIKETGKAMISLTGGSLALDLNGHKLSSTKSISDYGIVEINGGDFTLEGSGLIESRDGACGILVKSGNVVINGGTVSASAGLYAVRLTGGSMEVNGGVISNSSGRGYGISVEEGAASVTVRGGEIKGTSGSCRGIYMKHDESSLTVCEGADISGASYGVYIALAASVQIEGGSIKATTDYGLAVDERFTGSMALSGGTFSGPGAAIWRQSNSGTVASLLKICEGADVSCYAYYKDGQMYTSTPGDLPGGTFTVKHNTALTAETDGNNVITVRESCAVCGYSKDWGAVTIRMPDRLVYGDLSGAISAETTLTQWKSVDVMADSLAPHPVLKSEEDPDPLTMADLTNNTKLAAGEHTLKVSIAMDPVSDIPRNAECTLPFTVEKALLTADMVTLSEESATYNGREQKPSVAVRHGETTLAEGTDYDVSYTRGGVATDDFTASGTVAISVTGKGNYEGTVVKTFTVKKVLLTADMVTLSAESATYNGSEQKPSVTVRHGETTLAEGTDYDVSYTRDGVATGDFTASGTVTITISGKGNYEGTVVKAFTVKKALLSADMVTLSADSATYNGSEQKPSVAVRHGEAILAGGSDYDVSYTRDGVATGDFTASGTVTITISGKGNYEGNAVKTFTVEQAVPYIAELPVAAGITYGDTLNDSVLSGGAVQYGDGAGQEGNETGSTENVAGKFIWKEPSTKPVAADSDKTEYTVVFTPSDTVNYHSVEIKVKLTVHKAANTPNMPGSARNVANSLKKVGDVPLPEGWEWQASDQDTALAVGEPVSAVAVYIGADKGNYEKETVTVTITRSTCEHVEGDVLYTGEGEREPTCTEDGLGHKECTVCGSVTDSGIVVKAPGHTGGTADCSHRAVCARCGQPYGDMDGSRHGDTEVRGAVAASCTAGGYTGDTYCKACGVKTKTGNATQTLDHDWHITGEEAATTASEGKRVYTCSGCGRTYEESIPKLPETPGQTEKPTETPGQTEKPITTEPPTGPTAQPQETVTPEEMKNNSAKLDAAIAVKWKGNALALKWKKTAGAEGYDVFAAQSGKKLNKKSLVKTVKSGKTSVSVTKIAGKKISGKKAYSVKIQAWKYVGGKKVCTGESRTYHIAGKENRKYTNVNKLKPKKKKYTLKKGKSASVQVMIVKEAKKKKLLPKSCGPALQYWSDNTKIAAVTSKGKVKAKKKGSCYIYVTALNGVKTKIKITVK